MFVFIGSLCWWYLRFMHVICLPAMCGNHCMRSERIRVRRHEHLSGILSPFFDCAMPDNILPKIYEPRHDKTNKTSVRPAKTQISLGIRPVWSESSLSAWRKLGSLATHDLSLRWAHSHFVGFVVSRLICVFQVSVWKKKLGMVGRNNILFCQK